MKSKKLRIRCWIEVDGEKFFGPGPAELLGLIDKHGSIARAAAKMGMSYKKAWDIVQNINTHGKTPLVEIRKGGGHGGGTSLTKTGKSVLKEYHSLTDKIDKLVAKNSNVLKWL
ncbi:MAG TPA: LysR family transcriptional regulator [Cyclobacteriaceae bacterium]